MRTKIRGANWDTWPGLPSPRLEELQRIYKEEFGKEITLDEAREMAQCLITLYKILRRPLPNEKGSELPDKKK